MKKTFLIALLFGFLLPVFLFAQNPTNEISPNDSIAQDSLIVDTTLVEKQIVTIDITAINELIQSTEILLVHLIKITSNTNWTSIDSVFTRKETFIDQEAEDFRSYNQPNLSKFFLENLRLTWANYHSETNKLQKELEGQLAESIDNINILLEKKTVLEKFYLQLHDENILVLKNRVATTVRDIDSVIVQFNSNKQHLLVLQTRVADKSILCEKIIEEIEMLDATLRGQVFSKTHPVIWNINLEHAVKGGLRNSFGRAYRNNYKSIQYYFSNVGYSVIQYLFVSGFIVFIVLFFRRRYMALGLTAETPGYTNIERVLINHPKSIILSLLLTLWIMFFPYIPLVLSDILFFVILIALSTILKSFIDNVGKKLLTTLSILLAFNILEVIIWYLGDYSRIYLFFEAAISIIMIYPFLSIYKDKNTSSKTRIKYLAKFFMPFIIFMYAVAFIENIFGSVNLTVLFIKIGVRSAAITMIAYGYSRIFENLSFAALSLIDIRFPNILLKYGDVIKSRTKKIINIIILLFWAESLLKVFEIATPFHEWLNRFFTSEGSIGSISVSLSDILLFGGILYFTFMIVTFVKTIVEGEILRKMRLSRGTPAAISMISRIFLVTVGILFALSSTGIDMSSFSMIAGALGVGIGFGLQNIVQNFISGLILIFERPIQVGDTVEVDALLGRVKDIGVRASNVITYDGAEVVVPNSNLISNNLINWTLSDSRKRVEIIVGVAYGSDPNQILELIKRVAVDHPSVEKDPPPLALFEGFGDSSLDFRLLFWVSFEMGLTAKSDVAVGIYNTFAEHDIEIPFPQVDLHVKNIVDNEMINKKEDEQLMSKKDIRNDEETDKGK